jgi:hypothetical protein
MILHIGRAICGKTYAWRNIWVAHRLDEKLPTLKDTLKQLEALGNERMRAQNKLIEMLHTTGSQQG